VEYKKFWTAAYLGFSLDFYYTLIYKVKPKTEETSCLRKGLFPIARTNRMRAQCLNGESTKPVGPLNTHKDVSQSFKHIL
jgi:hypothetical protein